MDCHGGDGGEDRKACQDAHKTLPGTAVSKGCQQRPLEGQYGDQGGSQAQKCTGPFGRGS